MSELPISAFPPPAGLAMMGADDAGTCVDGVCLVPEGASDGSDLTEER